MGAASTPGVIMRGVTALVVLVSLVGVVARAARSQEPENLEKAKAYFQAGVDAYDQAQYEVALKEFGNAHALSHSPALYFNMAACAEHLGRFQAAAFLLRQYLIEKPDADDHSDVELRIKSLENRDVEAHRAPAVTPQPAPVIAPPPVAAESAPPRRHLKYTWIALAFTGAAGVATIGVGAYTVSHHGALAGSCGATAAGCSSGEISGLESAANATDALIAVTAVGAVLTVVAAIVETRHARTHASAPRQVAWSGAGIRF